MSEPIRVRERRTTATEMVEVDYTYEQLLELFDTMPDPMEARVMAFAGEDRSGFIIKWAKKGIGFGEFTISIDNKTMEVHTDDECMGAEFIAETFRALCN